MGKSQTKRECQIPNLVYKLDLSPYLKSQILSHLQTSNLLAKLLHLKLQILLIYT